MVVGANGQDGGYLVERLRASGRTVVGVGRAPAPSAPEGGGYAYRSLDVADAAAFRALLDRERPDAVFYAAAVHGAAGFAYEPHWDRLMAVNATGLLACLDAARTTLPGLRTVYFGSAKVFGPDPRGDIDEGTPLRAACLYSISKTAGLEAGRYYRREHGCAVAHLILFNHDSPRRPREYFMQRVAEGIARRVRGGGGRVPIRTLDFHCDWSDAEEVAGIAAELADRGASEDLVVASGRTEYAWDVVEAACAAFGVEPAECLEIADGTRRRGAAAPYAVRTGRLLGAAGRVPVRTAADVLRRCVSALLGAEADQPGGAPPAASRS